MIIYIIYDLGNEVPDLITGDFDSADKENIDYFKVGIEKEYKEET